MTTFPAGVVTKPTNIADGLQILASHVSLIWDEVVQLESEFIGLGGGSFTMDLRPSAAGNVILQSRQLAGDTQPRFQQTGSGDHRWGSGSAATDVTLARSATRTLTLTGSEILTPGNSADIGLQIKGAASQTGLLFDIQDSTAVSKFSVTVGGVVTALTVNAGTAMTAPTLAPGTNTTGVATTAFVTAAVSGSVAPSLPTGSVLQFAGSAAPTGFQLCDGTALNRTTFAALFAIISTDYGVGDGSTTFNVPDCRGRTTIGAGTGGGLTARTRATTGGNETHVMTTAELVSHNHGGATATQVGQGTIANSSSHTHHIDFFADMEIPVFANGTTDNDGRLSYNNTGGGGVIQSTYLGEPPIVLGDTDTGGIHSHAFTGTAHSHTISAQGTGTASPLMQPYLVTNYIIKT